MVSEKRSGGSGDGAEQAVEIEHGDEAAIAAADAGDGVIVPAAIDGGWWIEGFGVEHRHLVDAVGPQPHRLLPAVAGDAQHDDAGVLGVLGIGHAQGQAQINTAIQQLDKVTQQNTSAAEEMSATSEELASQAEQLQAAISYFRVDNSQMQLEPANDRVKKAKVAHLRDEIMAKAPHMAQRKAPARRAASSGGFDLDLDDGHDELDGEFSRRGAA